MKALMRAIKLWFEPQLAVKGFLMGCADVVPGVSGGTVAFVTGIYERMIGALRSFDWEMLSLLMQKRFSQALARPHWAFILQLALGIALALYVFTRVLPIPLYLETHPQLVYGLFFGLIAGSIAVLLRGFGDFQFGDILPAAVGVAAGIAIVTLVPVSTPEAAWFLILAGFLAISAGLLPGVSGSFVLLILGKYAVVLNAIAQFDLSVLAPLGLGILVGLLVMPRFIGSLLQSHRRITLMVITGLLTGSLYGIWPFRTAQTMMIGGEVRVISIQPYWPEVFSATVALSIGLMAVGVLVVVVLGTITGAKPIEAR